MYNPSYKARQDCSFQRFLPSHHAHVPSRVRYTPIRSNAKTLQVWLTVFPRDPISSRPSSVQRIPKAPLAREGHKGTDRARADPQPWCMWAAGIEEIDNQLEEHNLKLLDPGPAPLRRKKVASWLETY